MSYFLFVFGINGKLDWHMACPDLWFLCWRAGASVGLCRWEAGCVQRSIQPFWGQPHPFLGNIAACWLQSWLYLGSHTAIFSTRDKLCCSPHLVLTVDFVRTFFVLVRLLCIALNSVFACLSCRTSCLPVVYVSHARSAVLTDRWYRRSLVATTFLTSLQQQLKNR